MDVSCAWVVVDVQHGFATPELHALAARIRSEVALSPGPVWALVQVNPQCGPLRLLRGWHGCSRAEDAQLLGPVQELNPQVVTKTGYGTRVELPFAELATFDTTYVAGADTDSCVLATSLALFDAGIPVVVRADLCLSAGGPDFHDAGVKLLARQLGTSRVQAVDSGS